MDYRKEEMWNDGRYEYERLPRHRLPPREGPPEGDYHRVVSVVRRPDDEGYPRYEDYSDPDFRDYDDPPAYERRSGPYRGEDPVYRWGRGEPPLSRHPDYRESREGFRRKPLYHPVYMRDRSPQRRESPFYRESPVTHKDSPHSRSGSSVSSRSYSPERAKFPPHQSRSKERPGPHGLRSSKDASPSSSVGIPPAKTVEIDKGSRLVESTFIEVASKWVSEKIDKVSESNLPDATEELVKAGTSYALYADQTADPEASISVNPELYETSPLGNRSKAIAAKTKEIEEVYRQDCETFGMVVKMLIDKDPSLEKQIQFALRQNLSEIGERCIEELKLYIAEYDTAHQDLA
ncbi:periphilin-1 [Bufo bufo]|uniref:periphilin-1 n=1 Tax=Bufo bufo TaxID=8384 RepID=UPI001ABEB742|nr:periphilin-1 [Bufo bufo]XP_040266777.1 periphilin-1 [Bufo bufo]